MAKTTGKKMTLIGAYGRDYSSKEDILKDWEANKDFLIYNMGTDSGRYINKEDAETSKIKEVLVFRYNKLTKSFSLKV